MRSLVDQQSVPPLATGATYDAVIAGGGPVSVVVERMWDEAVLAHVASGSVAQGDSADGAGRSRDGRVVRAAPRRGGRRRQ